MYVNCCGECLGSCLSLKKFIELDFEAQKSIYNYSGNKTYIILLVKSSLFDDVTVLYRSVFFSPYVLNYPRLP